MPCVSNDVLCLPRPFLGHRVTAAPASGEGKVREPCPAGTLLMLAVDTSADEDPEQVAECEADDVGSH